MGNGNYTFECEETCCLYLRDRFFYLSPRVRVWFPISYSTGGVVFMSDQKRWFKVWTSLLVDMDNMSDADIGRWVRLGCRIALVGNNGEAIFDDMAHLGSFLKMSPDVVKSVIDVLPNVALHIIDEEGKSDNGKIAVIMHNWIKYQCDSTVYKRVKNFRKRKMITEQEEIRGEEKRRDKNTPYTPQRGVVSYSDSFLSFWQTYPKKIGKGAAWKSWGKISGVNGNLEKILTAVQWQIRTDQWTKNEGEFIPNPATWLNQRRWEDEKSEVRNGRRVKSTFERLTET